MIGCSVGVGNGRAGSIARAGDSGDINNGRAVVVRVNDRGPIVQGRIIDLSYGAAQVLQFQEQGLQRVRLDVVKRGNRPHVALLQTVAYSRPVAELP